MALSAGTRLGPSEILAALGAGGMSACGHAEPWLLRPRRGISVRSRSKAHTRFRHLFQWDGGETILLSRAVDETGYRQPLRAELFAQRGPGAANYHMNPVTGWVIRPDGVVVYKEEAWA